MNDDPAETGPDIPVSERMTEAGLDNFDYDERFDDLEDALARAYRAMARARQTEDAIAALKRDGWIFDVAETSARKLAAKRR